ncbi:hypothetical protein [Sphingopyxis sp.]|uniref:hypothetical protein n=1 Tax=Sphingopyxis sp. TaxID=1908224 RepID=UPI003BABB917
MIGVWTLCVLAFIILPFQLESRTVTAYGFVLLAAFVVTFAAGSFLASPTMPKRREPYGKLLDLSLADKIIRVAATVAIIALLFDLANSDFSALDAAFKDRDERSVGVLMGRDTGGSLLFQLAFLTYPVGAIAIAREILFRERVNLISLGFFGFGPPVLAALGMGGRGPILYAILIMMVSFATRRLLFPKVQQAKVRDASLQRIVVAVTLFLVMGVAMNYFVQVFVARASVMGGIEAMLQVSALNWGVSFDGAGSETLRSIVGDGNMYLIYVFLWYLVQGLVMSNAVFSDYGGDMTWGIYGLDLASAAMRRIDPQFVSNKFLPLVDINVYGFLPSAFGSLYVDFWYFAFIPTFAWGYAAGFVYRRIGISDDSRWVLIGPFITVGIIVSLMNTPLGFANGLTTHFWLLVVAFAIRPVSQTTKRTAPA